MPRSVARAIALALLLAAPPHAGGAQATATPAARSAAATRLGFSVERLGRIDRFLQRHVDDGAIAGAVALVLRDGRVVYEKAVGWSDVEAKRPMTADAIFRIASQTKALTSVAVMMLMEEGKLSLGDPVSRFIPEYAKTTVATKVDTGVAIVAAKRAITIRDLLTHTAGISYGTEAHVAPAYEAKGLGPAAGWGWYTADKDEAVCTTMERLASLPFVAQPGEEFVYGYATDILGCVVERASKTTLDMFIRTRITEPLGMRDTHFFVPREKGGRLVTVYASGEAGRVARAPEGARGQGHYAQGPQRSFAGGAGLVSTARDYARFLQMLLNGGELDGVRLLAPKTVALMTTNAVGTRFSTDGLGFGLGFMTVERFGANGLSSEGAYGWGGAYGSGYGVDPHDRLVYAFMINQLPNRADVGAMFPTMVYQALTGAAR